MIIQLKSEINPVALKIAMGYRGISQIKLCKDIKGLSQPNLSKFLKGYFRCVSEEKLKKIMKYLDFPFEFLFKYKDNISFINK